MQVFDLQCPEADRILDLLLGQGDGPLGKVEDRRGFCQDPIHREVLSVVAVRHSIAQAGLC